MSALSISNRELYKFVAAAKYASCPCYSKQKINTLENTTYKSALIVGASGLVGSHCLNTLLEDDYYNKVVSLGRRTLPIDHEKLEQHVVDFEKLNAHATLFQVDHIFCCLGTTIKKAGTKANFRKVDYHYPVAVAKLGLEHGAQCFSIITALGANSESWIFYNKVKGDVEKTIKQLDYPSVHIFQPSLLMGDRKETRIGEQIGAGFFRVMNPFFAGPLGKYKAIEAHVVGRTMVICAKQEKTGFHIYESDIIQLIYNKKAKA